MTAHQRALAPVSEPAGDGRTVDVLIMRWDTPARVSDDGRTFYTEEFAPGGLAPAPGARLLVSAFDVGIRNGRHVGGELVGRIVATENRPDGLYGTVRVARSSTGTDLLALLDPDVGVVEAVSIEFDDDQPAPRAGAKVRRTGARLTALAFTPYPQHPGSRVLAARSQPPEDSTMPEPTPTPAPEPEPTVTPAPTPEPAPQPTPAARAVPAPEPAPRAEPPRPGRPGPGADRFPTFGHFARAVAMGEISDDERDRYFDAIQQQIAYGRSGQHARALADLTTPTQTGVVHTQWINEVVDLYNIWTPSLQLLGTRPLPEEGMDFNVPKVTARGTGPTVQATQKTEVASSQKTIGHVPFTIATYGEGADVSLQLVQRSSPSYVTELMRIFTGWMAEKVDIDVTAGLVLAADDVHTALEYTTADAFDDLVVDAASLILGAAGLRRFPEWALLSIPLWQALAKLDATDGRPKYPHLNPMNATGRINVTDGEGNIRGLDFAVSPSLTGGVGNIRAVIGVRDAYQVYSGPMGTVSADVPARLGRDIAVYQFLAHAAVDARGLVLVTNAA